MKNLAPFTQNQLDYFRKSEVHWLNIAEGAKRSGKDVLTRTIFCRQLLFHPDRLHLVAGVSSGVAGGVILEGNGHGVKDFFTLPNGRKLWRRGNYENKSCLYVDTPSGEKVLIVAGGGNARSKDFIQGLSFGMVYITEANLCDEGFVRDTVARVGASRNPKVFHTLNPLHESHWYYQDFLQHYAGECNWAHFTPVDNGGLTDKQLRDFVASIPKGTVWYARDILGQRRQAEGLVYDRFSRDEHVVEAIGRHYTKYIISCDYGTRNAMVFLLWGLCNGVWHCIKEYVYSGRTEVAQKNSEMYRADLADFAAGLPISRIIIDPSAADFRIAISPQYVTQLADNDVARGIRAVADALHLGLIKINDCCKHVITGFERYVWDEKRQGEVPLKDQDDEMDALRYFVYTAGITRRGALRAPVGYEVI